MVETNPSSARRDLDGILILDKPVGLTSNQALQRVKRMLRARKAGHCGSLDPLATGVLPLCLGQATKFSSYLLEADKTYLATCRLGQTTTTADAEGEIIEAREVEVNRAQIEAVLPRFRGEIMQIPPMYSALKHQGKRLYQLARAGQEVEREPRAVTIHKLELCEYDGLKLKLEVCCSKGTYIRSLAQDIGEALGCGAHLTALRRRMANPFVERDSITLEQLQHMAEKDQIDALLLPVSAALNQFPELNLDARESERIRQGKVLSLNPEVTAGLYRLNLENGEFLGLGEAFPDGQLKAKRLMNTAR